MKICLCSECLLNYRFTFRIDRFRFTQTSFPISLILYKVGSEVCFLYYYFSVYCNLFKELFLLCSLELDDRQRRRSFSKADAKVRGFRETRKCFRKKSVGKHAFFLLIDRIEEKVGWYTLYNIYRREEG